MHDPLLCPVSSELQLVRRHWIEQRRPLRRAARRPARRARLLPARRPRPAASACSSRPFAPARSSPPTANPTTTPSAGRLRLKHAGVNFQPLEPGGHLMPASRRPCSSASGPASSRTTAASCRPSRSAPSTPPGARRRDDQVVLTGGLGTAPPTLADLLDYEVIVVQYATGVVAEAMRELQAAGVKVLYEIDDYVQAARKNKSHELPTSSAPSASRDLEMGMRAADGMICSTATSRAATGRSTSTRGNAATASTSSATRGRSPPARASRSAGPAASATRRRWRAGSPRSAPSCASAPETCVSSRSATRAAADSSRSSARARDRTTRPRDRGLPGVDDAVRHRLRPVGREQPVPRQERPALARGERARHPARRASGRLSRTSRTASPACTRATPDEVEAALLRWSTTPSSASGSARSAYEHVPSTGASRSPPRAGAKCCARSSPATAPAPEKVRYRSAPWLPITSVSHGRRSRSHKGFPAPSALAVSRYIWVAGGRPHIPHRGTDRDGRPL